MSVLAVRDLHVTYRTRAGDVPAVRGVSFEIGRGEVLGMAGESGCGKSTIVNAAMRLLPPGAAVSGQVLLDGEDVLSMSPGRLRAARWAGASVIFQGALHAMNPVRTVGDQIEEAMLVHGVADGAGATRRTADLLEQVGLPARRARDYPHELSGGQKQRVMIAMALACDPKVVIADEPTTALDVMVQAQVLRLLQELQDRLGLAMLFITHDLSVLVEVCDRLAIMYAGSLVEEGPAGAVFREPLHPYTRALAAAYPAIGDARYRLAPSGLGGDPPQPESVPPGCAFHPRCPVAVPACSTTLPPTVSPTAGRSAACLLVEGNRG